MEHYKIEKEKERLWLIEKEISPLYEMKTESILAQCNGYMGVRAAHSFISIDESRGMFLRGAFDKAYENEVTELVNCPDVTWFGIEIDSEKIHLNSTKLLSCSRKMDILSGELRIEYLFELSSGLQIEISCKRFASMKNTHLFVQSYQVRAINGNFESVVITTGINGQMTNSGVSHFHSVSERVYNKEIMESTGTLKDNCVIILNHCSSKNLKPEKKEFLLKRRSIYGVYYFGKGDCVQFEKAAYIYQKGEIEKQKARSDVYELSGIGYEELFEMHKEIMQEFWDRSKVFIKGMDLDREARICFAQYHILGMTPPDTEKCSIAAKGLTGEGYKGHVFWDTEIFLFPFLLFTYPDKAKNLLKFRYYGLDSAREKAKAYGFSGAMFPWEAAKSGKEETPEYAALNIYTGKANRVWSGIKEYHVTADIIYAVEQYYSVTGDTEFMENYGYEIIFEAAKFWVSCAKWDFEKKKYFICNVIGPDEYTEHVDNNAYTNYMAEFCVRTAFQYAECLRKKNPQLIKRLNEKTKVLDNLDSWKLFLECIYLPQVNAQGIIPQDDTFLQKPCLKDLDKYKTSQIKQSVLLDYSRDEVVNMQILKQADVVMLLNLFPDLFPADVVKRNVIFYEARTIHDSSLSYCAHAQACARIGDIETAEKFFEKALEVDVNDNPYDSVDGIHSAALGGIWSCLVLGFAGIHYAERTLSISPHIPQGWGKIEFSLVLAGVEVRFQMIDSLIIIESQETLEEPISVIVDQKKYQFIKFLEIKRE